MYIKNILPRKAIGKPSEVALLRFMEAFTGTSIEDYQRRYWKRLEAIFNHRTKVSFKIVQPEGENRFLVCLKGEPETLIERCPYLLTSGSGGTLKRLSHAEKEALVTLVSDLCRRKYRTIAVAQAYLPLNFFSVSGSPEEDMATFNDALVSGKLPQMQLLGILVLENPVRESVPEAIFKCRNAGIQVIMTTADHPQTALSIAKTVGIVLNDGQRNFSGDNNDNNTENIVNSHSKHQSTFLSPNKNLKAQSQKLLNTSYLTPSLENSKTNPNLYTTTYLSVTSDSHLRALISSFKVSEGGLVFARLSPGDKLRIVTSCRHLPRITAATGIGSSDLPIFEAASVRIALAQYGADICKANCDVLLLDDNFASIVAGIEEGRVLWDNMKKSLCYTLSSKPVELLPYLLAFTVGMPKMASSITIMAIDLVADNFPPIALGYERAEGHVMREPPRYLRRERVVSVE